jgi:hypothetical protein
MTHFLKKKITASMGAIIICALLFTALFYFFNMHPELITAKPDDKDTSGLGIKDLIRKVKAELVDADHERIANNEDALFKLKDFEMEISYVVSKRYTAKGKFEYSLVTVEGEKETGTERVQKLHLHWDAVPEKSGSALPEEGPLNTTVTKIN